MQSGCCFTSSLTVGQLCRHTWGYRHVLDERERRGTRCFGAGSRFVHRADNGEFQVSLGSGCRVYRDSVNAPQDGAARDKDEDGDDNGAGPDVEGNLTRVPLSQLPRQLGCDSAAHEAHKAVGRRGDRARHGRDFHHGGGHQGVIHAQESARNDHCHDQRCL